jgi:hypothetical protein
MLRALSLTMTMLFLPLESAAPAARLDPDANAAQKYWQAFATLPAFTQAEKQKIGECLTTPLDEPARQMLVKAEYALQMLHRGAAHHECDWGISYEDGIFTRLPHTDAARVLSSLACLRARLRFEAGETAAAINDLLAAMTLGRHVSLDRSIITGLVAYNMERRMIEILARYLPRLDGKAMADLRTRLSALPPFGSQATALLTSERESLSWFMRNVRETKDKASLLSFLSWVGISEGVNRDSGEKARAFLEACGGTAEGVLKFADDLAPCYAITAKMFDLKLDEFEKEFKRESIKRANNPVYHVFFSALAKAREARARADVRRALLSAAIDVQFDGPGALKDHLDPVLGGQFEYDRFPGGFVLRSKLKSQDDNPITLTVGQRG